MLQTAKKRLIFLYTVTTGTILTAVILIVSLLLEAQIKASQQQIFQNNVYSITSKLQSENMISNTWLSETEYKNHMIISIWDNGKKLQDYGSFILQQERYSLIDKSLELIQLEKFNILISPVSYREIKTKYFYIKNKKQNYYGAAVIIPQKNGYRSLILLQNFIQSFEEKIKQNILYLLVWIVGILSLYFVSRFFVKDTLKPVEENRKKQNEFVASASHELKSPLAVIRSNVSIIQKIPEESVYYSEMIEKECERMKRLIDDLVLLASTDTLQWSLRKERIELDTILLDTYDAYVSIFKEHKMNLQIELPEDILPVILGDEQRIKQVLAILLDNAVSHSSNESIVLLRAYIKKNYICIEIEDHGIGIPDEKKDKIFERFYQINKARSKKWHFGLGLSIAKELTAIHGGTLTVKDTIGGGSTFIICLPYKIEREKKNY